jgi:transcriptional regulator with XRE-family HTH domain
VQFVASRAGIASSTLSRIERGLRSADNRYLVSDLAAALECSVADLVGQPYVPADRILDQAHARMPRMRAAIANSALDEPPADELPPRPLDVLTPLTALIDERPAAGDYAGVVDLVCVEELCSRSSSRTDVGRRRRGRNALPSCRPTSWPRQW